LIGFSTRVQLIKIPDVSFSNGKQRLLRLRTVVTETKMELESGDLFLS